MLLTFDVFEQLRQNRDGVEWKRVHGYELELDGGNRCAVYVHQKQPRPYLNLISHPQNVLTFLEQNHPAFLPANVSEICIGEEFFSRTQLEQVRASRKKLMRVVGGETLPKLEVRDFRNIVDDVTTMGDDVLHSLAELVLTQIRHRVIDQASNVESLHDKHNLLFRLMEQASRCNCGKCGRYLRAMQAPNLRLVGFPH